MKFVCRPGTPFGGREGRGYRGINQFSQPATALPTINRHTDTHTHPLPFAKKKKRKQILDPRPRAAVLRSKAHPAAKASGESCGRLAGPRPRGPAILPPNGTARRPPAPGSAPPRAQAARRLPAAPARAPASRNPLPWGALSTGPPRTERPSRNLSQGTVDDERRRKSRLNGRVGEQREMGSEPPPTTFQTFGGGVRRKGASRPGRGVAPPRTPPAVSAPPRS